MIDGPARLQAPTWQLQAMVSPSLAPATWTAAVARGHTTGGNLRQVVSQEGSIRSLQRLQELIVCLRGSLSQ